MSGVDRLHPLPMSDIAQVFAVMVKGVVGDAVEEVVLVEQPFGHIPEQVDDGIERLNLLRHYVLQRYVFIPLHNPDVRRFVIEQGGAEIGVTEMIEEGVEGGLGPARDVRFAVQDLVHAVGDIQFVGKDVSEDVLDRPFPRYALQGHAARVADAVQGHLEPVAFAHQLFDELLFG